MEHIEDTFKIVEAAIGNRIAVRVHSKDGQILEASQIGILAAPDHKINGKKTQADIFKAELLSLVNNNNLKESEVGFLNRFGVFVPFVYDEGDSPIRTMDG